MEFNTSGNSLLLVGDKFGYFAENKGAMAVSKFANLIESKMDYSQLPENIIFGQGVSESWLIYIKSRINLLGVDIKYFGDNEILSRTGRQYSHKVNRKNILIADPNKLSENLYSMNLCVDDDCEIMADHATGSHIQGMVLIEAARQAFLSVSEWFLLPSNSKYYFVINKFEIDFKKFAFPLPTEIMFKVLSLDESRDDRLSATVDITFLQNDEVICGIKVDYTAILEEKLMKKENQMALDSLKITSQNLKAKSRVNMHSSSNREQLVT